MREKASRLDYEMNANGDIALQYTIWTNTASDFFFFNSSPSSSVDLLSPATSFNITLAYDTTLSRLLYPDTCREYIIEMVFRSSFFSPSLFINGGSPVDFEVGYGSFTRDAADNLQTAFSLNGKLRLFPHQNSNGQWVFDSTGTISSPIHQPLAYPRLGRKYTIPLGPKSLGPGIDSIKVTRSPWPPGVNFKTGYNYFYPFPDKDESPLNENNEFSISQQTFSFEVNSSSNLPYLPFECAFPLRYEYFSANGKFAESSGAGYAAFHSSIGMSDAVASYNYNGSFGSISSRYTQDTIDIWHKDSLQIDLIALKLGENLNWSLDFNGINPGLNPGNLSNWQSGSFTSLNSNGSFNAVGQSLARFTWVPSLSNYWAGPKNFKLIFSLGQGNCANLKEKTLELVVQLKMPLQILSGRGEIIEDTLLTCAGDFNSGVDLYVNALDDSTSFYWSPGYIFGGRDSAFYQRPSFDTLATGYIYIRRFSDDKAIDSVFIKTLNWPDPLLPLSVKDDWIRLPDSIRDKRSWYNNNLAVDYATYDSLPILGSGLYRSWYYQDDYCSTPTDSIWLEDRFLAANFNHRDSMYQYTTLLWGPDSVFRLSFADPVSSIYLREINLLQVRNIGTEVRSLKYSFGDANGVILEDSIIVNPGFTSSFQRIPIGFALAAQTSYYLEVHVAQDLMLGAYRNISFPQEIRVSRPMDFLSFEKGKGTGPLVAGSRPFGIGMIFDNFVSTTDTKAKTWSVYPNPAHSYLAVDGLKDGSLLYKISDLQGRTLRRGHLNSSHRIPLAELPTGTYLVEIENERKVFIVK